VPRWTDQHAGRCGTRDEGDGCRGLRGGELAGAHGCGGVVDEPDEGVQEAQGTGGEEVGEEEIVATEGWPMVYWKHEQGFGTNAAAHQKNGGTAC